VQVGYAKDHEKKSSSDVKTDELRGSRHKGSYLVKSDDVSQEGE